VCLIAKRVHEEADQILDRVYDARSLEQVFNVIRNVKGYGPFLAYEVVSDLLYTGITPFNVNDWANAGPGAMNGIHRIFFNPQAPSELNDFNSRDYKSKHLPKDVTYLDLMQWLREHQDIGFECVKRIFGCDFNQISWQNRELDLRCIEHQLCEYSKIMKLYAGTGRNFSGHVKPIDRGPEDFERMKAAF
jgi:hypothetical protein